MKKFIYECNASNFQFQDLPLTHLTLLANEEGLERIYFGSIHENQIQLSNRTITKKPFEKVMAQLELYFEDPKKIDSQFLLPQVKKMMTPFHHSVLKEMSQIAVGETQSYSDLAARVQRSKAARAIGQACNRNPFPILIPCHRVVAKNQGMGGFAGGIPLKQALLEFEGVALS